MPVDSFLDRSSPTSQPAPTMSKTGDAFRAQELAGADTLVDQFAEPLPDVNERRLVTIPVDGGTIDLLIYTPDGDGAHPAHLYLHGGG
jgi:acetyl esterase